MNKMYLYITVQVHPVRYGMVEKNKNKNKATSNFIFGKLHLSILTSKLLPPITKCKPLAPPPPLPSLRFNPMTFTEFSPFSLFKLTIKSYATEKLALLKICVFFDFFCFRPVNQKKNCLWENGKHQFSKLTASLHCTSCCPLPLHLADGNKLIS